MSKLDLKSLPEPGNKFKLGLKIGGGVGGEVYEAVDNETEKKVAVKAIELKKETEDEIQREYNVLKQMSGGENFLDFYGIYSKKGKDNSQKIWLVMEFCEGGDATSLVQKLEQENKKMNELHIAYIMRETIKAVICLQENGVTHRDVRGSNVLLTTDGRIKLIDYGISKRVEKNKKMKTCVGSPSWLAPEVIIASQTTDESAGYDKKADVWALGITAIELGDGQAPFEDTHPGRALFQIVNNPPPTLRKPSEWSQLYNDFISECLIKNPENRPYVQELLVHPFFQPLEGETGFLEDLTALLDRYKNINLYKKPDVQVRDGFLKTEERANPEKILQEDLAAVKRVSEDSVLFELHERLKRNEVHTFIGDILLILNSNKVSDEYGMQYHKKYRFKAKSQNAPHIYSIADSAYREVFHHEKPQHILFSGETGAGKTANMLHAVDHLLFLGQGLQITGKVTKALNVIHAMGNAATPHNPDSTRHVLQTQLTFTDTGKVSGAVFRVYLLEKERVTMTAKKQANFHLFYQFYDAIKSEGKLSEFHLEETDYSFISTELKKPQEGQAQFESFESNLTELGFEKKEILAIRKTLAAILLLGETEFLDDEDGNGVLASSEAVKNVADLLGVDKKKLSWALLNYCLIVNGEAVMRRSSKQEADEAKNVLARGLYSRLVDWVVNAINEKISVCRVIYGDRHVVSLLDLYGFECYKKNGLSQLFVNAINEQLQFHYNQKVFAWDKQTAEEEGVPLPNLEFKDNAALVDLIMSKPDGLLHKIDEATRDEDSSSILDGFKSAKDAPIFAETSKEFSINHYTGKVTYDATAMAEKNRDFLPPEIIDTMRLSTQDLTKQLFSSLLSKSGNLSRESGKHLNDEPPDCKRTKKNVNTTPSGRFSQSRQMRTAATTFRGASLDLFKTLARKEFGFHFVRCIRTDLSSKPGAFDPEVVRQQLRALAVVNTVLTIQQGYSYNVSHEEFIRRYKFLAFDFDENVEETKENCRLLLLRLKLEGWTMGKTKVFLKYFNKEYLSRLYEMQIKKIVKVQSMMRAFVARRKLYAKIKRYQVNADKDKFRTDENETDVEAKAARIIQKRFREYASIKRKAESWVLGLSDKEWEQFFLFVGNLTESEKEFIRPWYKRWRSKSIFQVLLLYRAERLQTLVNFCLQIHLYNQNCLNNIQKTKDEINLDNVNFNVTATEYLPPLKPSIPKLMFLWESLNLQGDISNCEPLPDCNIDQLEADVQAVINEKAAIVPKKPEPKYYEDKEIQTMPCEEKSVQPTEEITTLIQNAEQKEETDMKDEENEEKNDTPTQELLNKVKKIQKQSNVTEDSVQEPEKEIQPQPRYNFKENGKELAKVYNSGSFLRHTDAKTHPPPIKPRANSKPSLAPESKFKTSINEMEAKFRNENYRIDSDDPPFNFRALLKKTNYPQAPRRNSHEDSVFRREIATFSFAQRKASLSCGKLNQMRRQSETTVVEIFPGILIYGKTADL